MNRAFTILATRETIDLQTSITGWSCWSAIDRNTYDRCGDPYCSCHQSKGSAQGIGKTEIEAVNNFLDEREERT